MKYITLFLVFFSSSLLSKDYTLKWFNFITILDSIEYKDKSTYRLLRADGSWEDNKGFYGSLKCVGPNKISANNEVELDAYCEAYDNEGDTFGLRLYRSSNINAGVGTATYIKTSGKYRKFESKKCTYAITYLNDIKKGFYKHICK